MTAELEALIISVEQIADRLRALARQPGTDEGPTRQSSTYVAQDGRGRYEIAADAFRRHGFPFNDLKVQRLCKKHENDFALKMGVWHVRLPDFDRYAERVKQNHVEF